MKKTITTMTVFVMTLCFALVANAAAITFGGMNDKIPTDSKVKIGTMKNGMKYYVRHNDKPENRAELRLVVRAGAFQEDDDQDGLAHNTEHMLFNGTKNFPKDALVKYLESTGMRFGADINASTSQERTLYMLQLPTDNQEIMDKGFQVLEDWAHLASFDTDEIDKERGVIIEEWRTRMKANRRVIYAHYKNLWDGTRFQLRNTIGADTNLIRNYDHDVIRRYYKDWYRPDLQAIIAVGDFDVDEMEKKIIAQFGKIPVHPNPREYKIYPLPKHKGIKVSIVQDKEYSRGMAHLMWVRDYIEPGTVGAMYTGFVRSLYDAMLGARLSELTQQAKPPYFGAMGGEGRMTFGTRSYALRYVANPAEMMTGYEAILKEAFRVKQHGFTATELDRTKDAFIKRFKSYYSERDKSESKGYASEFFRNFLYKETMPGIEYEYEFVKHFMPQITLEEVNALAQEYMIRNNLAVMITAPEKEGLTLPSEEDFIAVYDK
ncbi:MAG: insulinase family protein, partial [Chlorobi bacterium]|nr:insulinase family protein [Chlorobiota bacterium]